MENNYVVIMAGGIGSRFWPASRTAKPKQFLDILGNGKSLLRQTYERFLTIAPANQILIVTHEDYAELVRNEIPEMDPNHILLEPQRQNTAPCIAYAAYKIYRENPKAQFVVAPSDHLILKEEIFTEQIKTCLAYVASSSKLITLGIEPTHPNTGYGYIHFDKNPVDGAFHNVRSFTEKPNWEKAVAFLADGSYLWNAGIFIWSAQSIIQNFNRYCPEISYFFDQIKTDFNAAETIQLIRSNYHNLPSISVDYAIMEKSDDILTMPANIGWSDIGTWAALHEVMNKDVDQNGLLSTNPDLCQMTASKGNLVRQINPEKLTIIDGLENYLVVDEKDVLLIYPIQKEQEIKSLLKQIELDKGSQYS